MTYIWMKKEKQEVEGGIKIKQNHKETSNSKPSDIKYYIDGENLLAFQVIHQIFILLDTH